VLILALAACASASGPGRGPADLGAADVPAIDQDGAGDGNSKSDRQDAPGDAVADPAGDGAAADGDLAIDAAVDTAGFDAAEAGDGLDAETLPDLDPSACRPTAPIDLLGFDRTYVPLSSGQAIQDKAWYLLTLVQQDPEIRSAVAADATLSALSAARDQAFRDAVATCGESGDCLATALEWSADDATAAGVALAPVLVAQGAVTAHLRPSGRFVLHAALADDALVSAALADALATLGSAFDTYGRPRDDVGTLAAGVAQAHPLPGLFFEPLLDVALASLAAAGRNEAARYEPLDTGQNAAAVARLAGIDWSASPFTVILVPGWGPTSLDQPISPLGIVHCDLAFQRWKAGLAPFLLLSGGHVHPDGTPYSEAIEMKKYLMTAHGVPEDAILVDPYARHTTTNVRDSARLMLHYGIPADQPALITSDFGQIAYMAGMDARCNTDLGYLPYRVVKILIMGGSDDCWLPSVLSLTIDARDPLDP
jgi:hypothetical protein